MRPLEDSRGTESDFPKKGGKGENQKKNGREW